MSTFIGFSRPSKPSLFTRIAMRLDSNSSVSHVFICYDDTDWDCTMVVQVDEFGFRLVPLTKFKKKNKVIHLIQVDKLEFGDFEAGLAKVAREFVGEMYDFKGFIGMALVLAHRAFKRKIKNPMASKQTIICSETAVLALQYAGCPGAEMLIADSTSPEDLLCFLKKNK